MLDFLSKDKFMLTSQMSVMQPKNADESNDGGDIGVEEKEIVMIRVGLLGEGGSKLEVRGGTSLLEEER